MTADLNTAKQLSAQDRRFGRYELLFRLASGGMASVYVGRFHGVQGFEKLLAIKRVHEHLSDDPEFIKMFFDEARLAARIAHPHVVQVIELGHVDEVYYIAMEYVNGESLNTLLRRAKPSFRLGARIIADAAAGLHAAHELCDNNNEPLNVVHRDISPQNILISYDGVVKVTDFGVARARDNLHSTSGGSIKGKFSYMSPEQALASPLDRRSDIFSLGIVLYELTTYHRLFKAETQVETLKKVTQQRIIPPSKLVDGYPERLEQIVLTALERDTSLRYQTAQEMQHEIERYLAAAADPVHTSDLADLMVVTFTERIAEKRKLLQNAQVVKILPEMQEGSTRSLSLQGRSVSQAERELHSLKRRMVSAILVLVLIAAGLGVYYFLVKKPDSEQPGTAGEIEISVSTEPSSASISIDNEQVDNPYKIRRPAGEEDLLVTAEAPGYVPRGFAVPLSKSGHYVVKLSRQIDAAVALDGRARPDSAPPPEPVAAQGRVRPRGKRPRATKTGGMPEPKGKQPKKKEVLKGDEDGLYGDNPFK